MSAPHTFVVQGDCLDVLKTFPDASISAVVTDPPYGLSKEPDMLEVLRHWLDDGEVYRHTGGGFMGKTWDSFVPGPEVWREVLRVLKPGGHALVFSGTRTYDLTVLAMRIAGFEIRDQLAWMYGSGFPKSMNVALAMAKHLGEKFVEVPHPTNACPGGQWCRCTDRDERSQSGATKHPPDYEFADDSVAVQWDGIGTALKPAQEPIVLARKPLAGTVAANVLAHGTGGINVDACRIGFAPGTTTACAASAGSGSGKASTNVGFVGGIVSPAHEAGRWPANVLFDETAAAMLDEQTGPVAGQQGRAKVAGSEQTRTVYSGGRNYRSGNPEPRGDTGGASRFFYAAKTSRAEREAGLDHLPAVKPATVTGRAEDSAGQKHARSGMPGGEPRRNVHPTVKPIALMRYLVRLITPPGGMVLDPFAGSGSTLCAAVLEGVTSVGIELTPEYIPIIEGRVEHCKTVAAIAGADARERFEADQ